MRGEERTAGRWRKFQGLLKTLIKIIFTRQAIDGLRIIILDVVFQRKVFYQDKTRWLMHTFIITGFLGLLLIVEPLSIMFHGTEFGKTYPQGVIADFFSLILLLGLLIAFFRRFVLRARQLKSNMDDTVSLLFILTVVVTGFIVEAVRFIDVEPTIDVVYSFVGYRLSTLLLSSWAVYHDNLWLIHSLISSAFLAYIPFSKFFHMLATPITILVGTYEEREERRVI
jgi:nitrate reductase gamma subunit